MKIKISWLYELLGLEDTQISLSENLVRLGFEVEGIENGVIEISTPANRGDCISAYGLARDLATLYKVVVKEPLETLVADSFTTDVTVSLQSPKGCPRYLARSFVSVDNTVDTPSWIKDRLESAGLQSKSCVVDLTNYVMLEVGHPLHAFASDRIGKKISIQLANPGEALDLLNGTSVKLNAKDLLVCIDEKPCALAGVIGCDNSCVESTTTEILLECAHFEPIGVRLTARDHKLQTDASYRYERGVDFNLGKLAVDRFSELLLKICGGKASNIIDEIDIKAMPVISKVELNHSKLEKLLGTNVAKTEVSSILTNLGMTVSNIDNKTWEVIPPSYRFDIQIEEDLIEEVARVKGYDSIAFQLPLVKASETSKSNNDKTRALHLLKNTMASFGYNETINYSFISPVYAKAFDILDNSRKVINPISDELSVMRASLWPGLAKVADYNKNRQRKRVQVFEVGRKYEVNNGSNTESTVLSGLLWGLRADPSWNNLNKGTLDFFDVKGTVEQLLDKRYSGQYNFKISKNPMLHPGQSADVYLGESCIGALGQLHPGIINMLSLPKEILVFELNIDVLINTPIPKYKQISKFPSVRRDISLILDKKISAKALVDLIIEEGGAILRDVAVVDCYVNSNIGTDNKSITCSLVYQELFRTLLDNEINSSLNNILEAAKKKLRAQQREYDDVN